MGCMGGRERVYGGVCGRMCVELCGGRRGVCKEGACRERVGRCV